MTEAQVKKTRSALKKAQEELFWANARMQHLASRWPESDIPVDSWGSYRRASAQAAIAQRSIDTLEKKLSSIVAEAKENSDDGADS